MSRTGTKRLSTDQLAFLLALIAYLNDFREASVAQLAEYFDRTEQEIRALIPRLTTFGLPGSDGSYQHNDLFDIDWDAFEEDDLVFLKLPDGIGDVPRLSSSEATALIMGLEHLRNIESSGNAQLIDHLIEKLALGSATPIRPPKLVNTSTPSELEPIRQAMDNGKKLSFDYLTSDGRRSHRTVAPIGLNGVNAVWYLRAQDFATGEQRTFRIDRMFDLSLSGEDSGISAEASSETPLFDTAASGLQTLTLRVGSNAGDLLRDFQAEQLDQNRYHISVAHLHTIKRAIVQNAGAATVIHPMAARRAITDWAATALSQYQ